MVRVTYKRTKRKFRHRRKIQNTRRRFCDYVHISAPKIFGLFAKDHRSSVLLFLKQLRQLVRRERCIMIDFSPTEKMYVDGTLLLRAEIERLDRLKNPGVLIRCKHPHNPKAVQVLRQVGVFGILRNESPIKPRDQDVIHWKVATGNDADGRKYEDVLGHYDGNIAHELQQEFFLGITEAMTNSRQHAYIDIREDGLNHNDARDTPWWMFSQFKDERLYVAFVDLGIGIPRTLPVRMEGLWNKLISKFGREPHDHEAIEHAIEDRKSRTQKEYRGKGLPQIVGVINGTNRGDLCIYSNRGCYTINRQDDHKSYGYRDSIYGTLITWSVPISGEVL